MLGRFFICNKFSQRQHKKGPPTMGSPYIMVLIHSTKIIVPKSTHFENSFIIKIFAHFAYYAHYAAITKNSLYVILNPLPLSL